MNLPPHIKLAYELGRLRWGLPRALAAVPAALVASRGGVTPLECLLLLGALAAGTVVAAWQSRTALHGAWAGIAAGTAPVGVSIFTSAPGHTCHALLCLSSCALLAAALGVVAGSLMGGWAARLEAGRLDYLLAGAATTLTISLFVCGTIGLGMVAPAVLGGIAGATPAFLVRRRGPS